jgi:hypothetical protein
MLIRRTPWENLAADITQPPGEGTVVTAELPHVA